MLVHALWCKETVSICELCNHRKEKTDTTRLVLFPSETQCCVFKRSLEVLNVSLTGRSKVS